MRTDYIKVVLTTAKTRNYTVAANTLGLDYSYVYRVCSRIEEELGFPLFLARGGKRHFNLTSQGIVWLEGAQVALDLLETAEKKAKAYYDPIDKR